MDNQTNNIEQTLQLFSEQTQQNIDELVQDSSIKLNSDVLSQAIAEFRSKMSRAVQQVDENIQDFIMTSFNAQSSIGKKGDTLDISSVINDAIQRIDTQLNQCINQLYKFKNTQSLNSEQVISLQNAFEPCITLLNILHEINGESITPFSIKERFIISEQNKQQKQQPVLQQLQKQPIPKTKQETLEEKIARLEKELQELKLENSNLKMENSQLKESQIPKQIQQQRKI